MSETIPYENVCEALERMLKTIENLQQQINYLTARQDVAEKLMRADLDQIWRAIRYGKH